MNISVRVFAMLKDFYSPQLSLELPDEATAGELREKMLALNPKAEKSLSLCRMALGTEFIQNDRILHDGEEVCFLPPASGG